MVVGGISSDPSRAVNAHAVQHSDAAIEYQNQLLLRVFDAAPMIVMRLLGKSFVVESSLTNSGCSPAAVVNEYKVESVQLSFSQTAERSAAAVSGISGRLWPGTLADCRFSPDESAPSTMIVFGCDTFVAMRTIRTKS